MRLDRTSVIYLLFRISPFIIVGCLVMNSFFNQDAKALAYIIGLIIACAVAFGSGTALMRTDWNNASAQNEICNTLNIGTDGARLSLIPLSLVIYAFTLMYIVYYILYPTSGKKAKGQTDFRRHWAIITILIVLMGAELWWQKQNNCINHPSPMIIGIVGIVIGSICGITWGILIGNIRKTQRYMNKPGSVSCWSPSSLLYMCRDTSTVGSIL